MVGGSNMVRHNFYVLNSHAAKNVILGVDFMEKLGKVTFDFEKGEINVRNKRIKTVAVNKKSFSRVVQKTKLPVRSETIVAVNCISGLSMVTADFAPSRLFNKRGIYAANCRVTPDVNGAFLVKVLNTNSSDVIIDKRQVCGQLKPPSTATVEQVHRKEIPSYSNTKPISGKVTKMDKNAIVFGEGLAASEKKELRELLMRRSNLFAEDPKKPNQTNLVEHKVLTGNNLPTKEKLRRILHAWEREVNEEVDEMLQNGIIRPSASPWNSPVLLVRKKMVVLVSYWIFDH